jgi:hypothetical protein
MNFDGSKRLEGAGAGVILVSPQGDKMKYILRIGAFLAFLRAVSMISSLAASASARFDTTKCLLKGKIKRQSPR